MSFPFLQTHYNTHTHTHSILFLHELPSIVLVSQYYQFRYQFKIFVHSQPKPISSNCIIIIIKIKHYK